MRPDYLIEHTPSLENGLGHQILLTSRSLVEVEAMMRSVLQRYSLPHDGNRCAAILESLRCLSGRLALKLIASPTQRAEALGLALSRMYLDHQGIFSNQIVVPLDAHTDLYREPRKSAVDLQEEVSLKRTDLALFDLNVATRTITCNLIEVKCYSTAGNLAQYAQLKDSIVEQLETSEKTLRLHFDPRLHSPDRIDRAFKTAELGKLLEFYIDRSARFGLLDSDVVDEAKFFIRTLDDGYELIFTRSALVFDFEKEGTNRPGLDNGVEFHRLGINIIRTLVDESIPGASDTSDNSGSGDNRDGGVGGGGTPVPSGDADEGNDSASSVPKLKEALFFVQARDRSVSWDSLTSRSFVSEPDITDIPRVEPAPSRTPCIEQDSAGLARLAKEPVEAAGAERRSPTTEAKAPVPTSPAPAHFVSPGSGVETIKESLAEAKTSEPLVSSSEDLPYDVLLGNTSDSPQYGILGEFAGRKIALDLNQTHTISLFGVQGGGKSYTLGSLAKAGSLNGEAEILRDPKRRWLEKFEAVTGVIDNEPDRFAILCDEPSHWFRQSASEVDDTPDHHARLVSDWIFKQAKCRRVVSGYVSTTGLSYLKQTRAPRIPNGRELLQDSTFWGGAAALAAGIVNATKRPIDYRPVMEIRLLVAWAWLFGPEVAAKQCVREFSATSLLEGLFDGLEDSAQVNMRHRAVCQAISRLAIGRVDLPMPVSADLLSELSQLESDIVCGCFCEERPNSITLHPLVAHEVASRARDRKREGTNAAWKLARSEQFQVHKRLFDLTSQTPAGESFRADLETLHHGVLSDQIQDIANDSRLHFVEQLHEIGRSLSYVFRQHQQAADVFRMALRLDEENAYSHHYLAFNLDWNAESVEEVEAHYQKAIELQPEHPWWWSRWISYLATRGQFKAAANQWRDALDALSVTEDATPDWIYLSLHRWVARWMLHWSNLDLAENVLRSIPSSLQSDASVSRLNDLLTALRYVALAFDKQGGLQGQWNGSGTLVITE